MKTSWRFIYFLPFLFTFLFFFLNRKASRANPMTKRRRRTGYYLKNRTGFGGLGWACCFYIQRAAGNRGRLKEENKIRDERKRWKRIAWAPPSSSSSSSFSKKRELYWSWLPFWQWWTLYGSLSPRFLQESLRTRHWPLLDRPQFFFFFDFPWWSLISTMIFHAGNGSGDGRAIGSRSRRRTQLG